MNSSENEEEETSSEDFLNIHFTRYLNQIFIIVATTAKFYESYYLPCSFIYKLILDVTLKKKEETAQMMMMNTCVQTYYTLRLLHTNIQRFSKVKSETDEMESVLTGSNYVIKFNH